MQTVSSTFDRLFKAHANKVIAVSVKKDNGSYDGFDQDTDYVYNQNTRLVSLSTNHALMDAPLKVGKCVVQEVNLVVRDPGSIPRAGEFKIGLKLDDGTTQSEWIPKGTFYVDTRKLDKETNELVIRGYDAMLKTEQDFIQSGVQESSEYTVWRSNSGITVGMLAARIDTLELSQVYTNKAEQIALMADDYISLKDGIVKVTSIINMGTGDFALWTEEFDYPTNWPQPDLLAVGAIAKRIGVAIDDRTLSLLTNGYAVGFPGYGDEAYTMREVLGFIGTMYAGNWCISDAGKLRLLGITNDALWLDDALRFSSDTPFTINTANGTKTWDGAIEWTDGLHGWKEWDGSVIASGDDNSIYLRGNNNRHVTNELPWVITGSNVACNGTIDSLLDWQIVKRGGWPAMDSGAFRNWLSGCSALTAAPKFISRPLTQYCYFAAFKGCVNLTTTPNLPATSLDEGCYAQMFMNCSRLIRPPVYLPSRHLPKYCYAEMFKGCTSLDHAVSMGLISTSLVLDYACYQMYYGCISLTVLAELYARTLGAYCYAEMFFGCSSLVVIPTQSSGFTARFRIPFSGTGTGASSTALTDMFKGTNGSVVTPSLNTNYYTKRVIT